MSPPHLWDFFLCLHVIKSRRNSIRCYFHFRMLSTLKNNSLINYIRGARGSVVGSGTMLQAGKTQVQFLMRSLDFSVDLILLVAQWPWGGLSL
jgi:hypothetical protein